MRITKLETILVGAPTPGCGLLSNRNYFYILLHTDEGLTGLGEATLESHDDSVLGCLKDLEDLKNAKKGDTFAEARIDRMTDMLKRYDPNRKAPSLFDAADAAEKAIKNEAAKAEPPKVEVPKPAAKVDAPKPAAKVDAPKPAAK